MLQMRVETFSGLIIGRPPADTFVIRMRKCLRSVSEVEDEGKDAGKESPRGRDRLHGAHLHIFLFDTL